jgi:uroporphyrinogen decarboxylase
LPIRKANSHPKKTSRDLVKKTLEFAKPERVPRQLWFLPWAEKNFPDQLRAIQEKYPDDIVTAPRMVGSRDLTDFPERYQKGVFIDEWGCRFENVQDGTIGIVHKPLIETWSDLEKLKTPDAYLNLNTKEINRFCRNEKRFVLAGTWIRPFERLQFLRATMNLLVDLVEQPPELRELIGRIHQFYIKEAEAWARTDVDALALMDDWGTQKGSIISPWLWRTLFKPLYQDYIKVARKYKKYVFFHSDGYIVDIIPEFIEIGVDALNSQIFCMGLESLGEKFKGKITFWGEIDRQHLLAYGSPNDVRRAVSDVYKNLYSDGGVIAQCEFGPGAKPENVEAVFQTWSEIDKKMKG